MTIRECYVEVGSQVVAYTTGVPAMIGAMLVMNGTWQKPGVYNMEVSLIRIRSWMHSQVGASVEEICENPQLVD